MLIFDQFGERFSLRCKKLA